MASQRSASHVALGRAVRHFREDRGLSQENLAYESKLERKTVYSLEGGIGNPQYESLRRICEVLEIRIGQLTSHADELEDRAEGRSRDRRRA